MTRQLNEKVAIGYVCSGETFREITLYQLENNCIDDENIYYLIITDKKEYFDQCTRKNLIVNELKEFYSEYPEVELYERFIEADRADEYYNKLLNNGTKFSFSIYRFHLIQAQRLGITNVAMLCVDTCLDYKGLSKHDAFYSALNSMFIDRGKLYNAVAIYGTTKNHSPQLEITWRVLKEKYGYETEDEIVPTPDAAGRLFIFESEEQMMNLFRIWNEMVIHLHQTREIIYYDGSRVINDEFLLGPIYHMVGIKKFASGPFAVDHRMMDVFWEGFGNVKFDQQYVIEKGLIVSNQ
jgi:hypothetical protein